MQPTSQPSNPPLILIVDDEPTVRKVLSLMLERAGYRIECAFNGLEALAKIKSLQPDLITLDYMMPDLTGEEVRAHILNDEEASKIPIIFVSAVIDEVYARQQKVKSKTGVRFLPKPFGRDVLLTYVSELLADREY